MIQFIIVVLLGSFTIALFFGIHQLSKRANEAQIQRHTREQHIEKLKGHYGGEFNLFAAIADALDRKSSWSKPMDVLFDVFRNNPELMLEYLVECWGVDAVQQALDKYMEQ